MEQQPSSPSSHILIFPLPVQGHVTPMLNLAQLLCQANLKVTFINTAQTHQRLTQYTNIQTRFAPYPNFRFRIIPDWVPVNGPKPNPKDNLMWALKGMIMGLGESAEPILREILFGPSVEDKDRVTCLIIDGWLNFGFDLAEKGGVPVIAFRCSSACCTWAYYCIPRVIEAGEAPFQGNEEMDQLVTSIPGMETFLRCRDLPSFCRKQTKASCSDLHQFFTNELQSNKRSHSLILNTFEDLEGPILSQIRSQFSRVYTIGPLHACLKYKLEKEGESLLDNSSSSLLEVDRSCLSWLDQKPNKSVIYVSLGSTTILTRDQYMEIWAGLVQSKKYFLWVIRSNAVTGSDSDNMILDKLVEETDNRGCMVKWAPQDQVLAHRAIGGFLTHSGWNSTLESVVAGVPMLCLPYFADQQVNSRFVSEVWRIGLDMKDMCDRNTVEKMINDLMDERKDELQKSMDQISHLAKSSISQGGSSCANLNLLIQDIKAMSKKGKHKQ